MRHSRRDAVLLFAARMIRLFAYGALSVVLVLYLVERGLSEAMIGVLLTATLMGDAGLSLAMTTTADRLGRRRMLLLGALLMASAGIAFLLTGQPLLLLIAAIIGVISPSGNEIGPFLSIEQAALAQLLPNDQRTRVLAWYNLAGSFTTALGALGGGWLAQALRMNGMPALDAYQIILAGYALSGGGLALLFLGLSRQVEVAPVTPPVAARQRFGLRHPESRQVVMALSGLFALDAFAGGFIVQSLLAYWFYLRFGADAGLLGSLFFGANVLAGVSALLFLAGGLKIVYDLLLYRRFRALKPPEEQTSVIHH